MKNYNIIGSVILVFCGILWITSFQKHTLVAEAMTNSIERAKWENQMLGDPRTGKIPTNARMAELHFVGNLNQNSSANRDQNRVWQWMGPKNIGGRTRALQYDIKNSNNILAGSASGGIFRSINNGQTWIKVSDKTQNLAITSLTQNPNSGSENTWYACTGELRGGNQISGNSAYSGDGILKSTDNGISWVSLSAFKNSSPQTNDSTDRGWRIIVSNQNSDVYFASASGIYKSTDHGINWKKVLGSSTNSSGYTDIVQTTNGTFYSALDAGTFSSFGVHRSLDGETWTNVSTGAISSPVGRMVLATDNQYKGERIYVLAVTNNRGKRGEDFRGNAEYHSLYKYSYISGNGVGSNGSWINLSANIPVGPEQFDDFITQSAYCMDIAVSPLDSNVVAIAGTNLYISDDAFKTDTKTRFAGGYGEKTKIPDFKLYPNHHPDLQTIVFHPTNSKIIMTGSDGGIHQSNDLYAKNIVWNSLNNNYSSTQFYTLAIDEKKLSNRVMGGLQDNGTLLSINGNPSESWTLPMSYDGGYCAFSNTEPYIYASKQLDGIAKIELDSKGERINWKRIDPVTSARYLFINPYLLDPNDNNTMYLPITGELWWNEKLKDIVLDGTFTQQTKDWNKVSLSTNFQPSAIAVSEDSKRTIYLGSTTGAILKIENIKSTPIITDITNSIGGRGYINSISIDPSDPDRILTVFSNYNTYSVFLTKNGADTWENISGNLEGTPIPGLPVGFEHINNGPSCRVGKIIPTINSTQYLVGTSVGLFSTQTIDSMNTNWKLISADYIQNNVISDIKFRELDSSLWISTFGGGIYKTHLTNSGYIAGIQTTPKNKMEFNIYPNPSRTNFTVKTNDFSGNMNYQLIDLQGKIIKTGIVESNVQNIRISQLPRGSYVLIIEQRSEIVYRNKVLLN